MATVETATGRLRGEESGGVSRFLGIPYAEPPVGPLRFLPARPVRPWSGERDATAFGARCVQVESLLAPKGEPESEDCLFLNVWSAELAGSAPVMLWIHGGSFAGGSGALSWYHGEALARRGVVVVSINYRLGALGFLHLEALGGERWAGAANAGLSDQRRAIEWIHENIGAFGGDPSRICVFGESAGAMSVGALLGDRSVTPLVNRAILQSGTAEHCQTADSGAAIAAQILDHLGVSDSSLDRLVDIPAADLVAASAKVDGRTGDGLPLPFQPTIDGVTMTEAPMVSVAQGSAADVDMLFGTTADEMQLFVAMAAIAGGGSPLDEQRLRRRIEKVAERHGVSADPAAVLAEYRNARGAATPIEVWSAISTDLVFGGPARRMGAAQVGAGGTAYRYLFTHRSTAFDGVLGAAHATEIPYVFDNLDQPGVNFLLGEITPERRPFAARCADAWVAFATDGVPAATGLPEWPAHTLAAPATMRLDLDAELQADPHGRQLDIWEP